MPDHLDLRRGRWGQDLGLLRAASTRGVIRARLLVDLGVPERTVYARCRDGGAWRRLLPGIILLSNGSPTREQMLTAALMHGGTTAMITGLEACRRHGVRRGPAPTDTVHLLVAHARQANSSGFADCWLDDVPMVWEIESTASRVLRGDIADVERQ